MVREDYKYVDKATDVCLTTTKEGHAYLDKKDAGEYNHGIDELLLFVEQDYCIVSGGIKDWVKAINKFYEESYSSEWRATEKIVLEALKLGYLGIRKVVWD